MDTITFVEGDQQIHFPSTWRVIKLDQHYYYKQVSGKGMKGVDFVAIDPNWGLYLIEIKDYRHTLSNAEKRVLSVTLESKSRDTIRLINSVYGMLDRKWYYKVMLKYTVLSYFIPQRSKFWIDAHNLIVQHKVLSLSDIAYVGNP